jgi:hypothetical protein
VGELVGGGRNLRFNEVEHRGRLQKLRVEIQQGLIAGVLQNIVANIGGEMAADVKPS